ncbi:hypothetical protein J5N97_019589 [Dioscorea zingiberensis]|uniref:Uncharacterized protein n=1 Tax=Dioscorea zingiberensis TaxID=325984 RepID=A0A9D5CF02_9LILI|nr:hypothetical protein J5N97_019589 [Dioscorea zingiberensis]
MMYMLDAFSQEEQQGMPTRKPRKLAASSFYKPKFSYIFCAMDGTLLNARSQISTENVEAISRGVNIVIVTGKLLSSHSVFLTVPFSWGLLRCTLIN